MQTYAAKRCQHIKVNGTQCGSPALRKERFCYYHQQNRPIEVEFYGEEKYAMGEILLPVFEDANSIQVVLRQVTQMLLQKRLDPKTAGLVLYALQIASSNLKRMDAEKARPTQVVIDPDKVEETPIGATPWSATGQGHDPEDDGEARDGLDPFMRSMLDGFAEHLNCTPSHCRVDKGATGALARPSSTPPGETDDKLPPGTIQACQGRKKYVI